MKALTRRFGHWVALRSLRTQLMTIAIGGMRTRIATYGELVTSVINPSHRVARRYRDETGDSPMRNYNEAMTVAELIDLVAFLQTQYTEFPDY